MGESGLNHLFRKQTTPRGVRGFESHSHRHLCLDRISLKGYIRHMASFLTHLLEGDSIARLDEYARKSADPAAPALAQIGKNFIIAGSANRLHAEMDLIEARHERATMEQERREARADEVEERRLEAQAEDDRELARELTAQRKARAKRKTEVSDFDLSSDEGVRDFMRSF